MVYPYMADQFADSMGVNTRFNESIYAVQRQLADGFLVELGFRHIRDGNILYDDAGRAQLRQLCTKYGIHSSLGLNDTDSEAAINRYVKDVRCVDMIEGPNELNGQHDWEQRLATFMPRIYRFVHGDAALAKIPVVAPSITRLEDAEALASVVDLSKYSDYGNKHSYPNQRNIGGRDGLGSEGYGPPHSGCPAYGYGSYFYNVCLAQIVTKDRPIWTTETGYSSTPDGHPSSPTPPFGSLPYDVAAKYFPRLMAYDFLNGVRRTYIMALLDGESGCNGTFNDLGLVEQDCPNTGLASSFHKKPAFYALKTLMSFVADPGPRFRTEPVFMRLGGAASDVQTLLLEKRSGEYVLLFWVEAPDWDPDKGVRTNVPAQRITLTIRGIGSRAGARSYAIDANGGLTKPANVTFAADVADLAATDEMKFLTFTMPDRGSARETPLNAP